MKLLKGKKIADKILSDLKQKIKNSQIKPSLAVVLVGKNQASETYVRLKEKAAKKVGIGFYLFYCSEKAGEVEITQKIKELNADQEISGIIVQLPLPKKFNQQKIINAIDPEKDADGFSDKDGGKASPVFPKAIIKILETVPKAELSENKKCVIIANSQKFGEIMKIALQKKGIKGEYILVEDLKIPPKITHLQFSTFAKGEKFSPFKKGRVREGFLLKIRKADIIISAVGIPKLIKGEMIKKGAIIIDGGITKKGQKVFGDVDFESVKNIAGYLSPVPGGVGPVTVACLLENVYILKDSSCV